MRSYSIYEYSSMAEVHPNTCALLSKSVLMASLTVTDNSAIECNVNIKVLDLILHKFLSYPSFSNHFHTVSCP